MVVARPDGVRSSSPSPAGEPLIVIDHVGKTYANGTVALDDISFDVHEGQFVSLVGPSGCGKSTLLRMIAGLGPITAGTILVEGLPPRQARQENADTAFVFQDATLMPWRGPNSRVLRINRSSVPRTSSVGLAIDIGFRYRRMISRPRQESTPAARSYRPAAMR